MHDSSYRRLPIEGLTVTQLKLDFAFGIELSNDDSAFSIRINTIFTLKEATETADYAPETLPACGPALRLFNAQVVSAKAFNNGRLEVVFLGGAVLEVNSNSQFEAWEVVGNDGQRTVALPGGGLAVWQPNGVD
ncbi:MAG: DUF6188 family protein [Planctomycetota bacterium]